jgi:endonuclease/exonuclease/phosphatase family metal-dependent hydrolase
MFDTAAVLPSTAQIGSAQLVITVKGGNAATRRLGTCAVPVSFREAEVTWTRRNASTYWSNPGGDVVGSDCSEATVTAVANSRVVFDVTRQVQKAVSGSYGSRYARFLIGDLGASGGDSYKQYFSNNASTTSVRPRLIVQLGTVLPPVEEPPDTTAPNVAPVFEPDPDGFRISQLAPAQPIAPATVYFTASAKGPESTDTLTYFWDFGDGTPVVKTTPTSEASRQNVVHTYKGAGSFKVKVTVLDQANNRSSRSGTISIAAPASASSGEVLKILQWNTYKGRTTDTRTEGSKIWLQARWMAAVRPDVILLQEVMGTDQASKYTTELEKAMPGTNWSYLHRSDANTKSTTAQGIAILTRLPIRSTASIAYTYCPDAGVPQRAAIAVTVPVNGRNVTLFTTHFSSYGTADDIACRYQQAKQLTAWAETFAGPRVITGDLNATPGQQAIVHLRSSYNDVWADAVGRSRAIAYPDNPADLSNHTSGARIDYVLASKGSSLLEVLAAQVPDTRDFTNDHAIYSQALTRWAPHNYAPRASDHEMIVATFVVK